MNWIDEHILNEIKFEHELPELTEICLLLEKLLLFNEKNHERNYLHFSRSELDLLITSMNIDINLLKEKYKLVCDKYTTYDESNFYTMIKPAYKSKRNPNIPLLFVTRQLLFDSTNDIIPSAVKMIQNINRDSFRIICKKIKHCILVSSIEKKNLYYLDNDYGNNIIEENFSGVNCTLVDHWRKLNRRKLCIEQYYPEESCSHFDMQNDLVFSEPSYEDYLNGECADLLPTISLNEYYSFENRMNTIALYQAELSPLSSNDFFNCFTEFDQLLTPTHDIYELSLNKIIWLYNYGAEYLKHNNPIFLQILFLLLFTSREDREIVKLCDAKSSLNIPTNSLNDYLHETEKIINLPSISECIIDKSFYHTTELYKDVHRLFFLNTPSWFKFLIIKFDNSHLRAAKLLYYESYIQRMHLRRTKSNMILSEIAHQLRLAEEDFDTIFAMCSDIHWITTVCKKEMALI